MTAVTIQSLAILLLSGMVVGAFIDGVRLLKDRVPFVFAKHWIIVELVAWCICGVGTFYVLYRWQDGHWRWVNFFAQIVGIFLYDRYLFRLIRLVMRVIVYSIITPFSYLFRLIWKFMLLLFYFTARLLDLLTFRRIR